MKKIFRLLSSIIIFVSIFLNIGLELSQFNRGEFDIQLPLVNAQTRSRDLGIKGRILERKEEGKGEIGLGTGTCVIVSGSTTLLPEGGSYCCQTNQNCVDYYSGKIPLAGNQTWTCEASNSCENTISTSPYIEITKDVSPIEALSGEEISYIVTIANLGSGAATGLEFNDTFPPAFEIGGYNTGILLGQTLTHSFNLSGHSSFTFLITGYFSTTGTFINTGIVSSERELSGKNCSGKICEDYAPVTIGYGKLEISKSVNKSIVEVGEAIVYTISVGNYGTIENGTTVQELINSGCFTYTGHQTNQGIYNTGTSIWTTDDIPVGQTGVLQIFGYANNTGICTNIVFMGSEIAQASFNSFHSGLSLEKSVSRVSGYINNDIFVYTLKITNHSAYPYIGVSIDENLPPEFMPSIPLPSLTNITIPTGVTNIYLTGTFNTGAYKGTLIINTAGIATGTKNVSGVHIHLPFCEALGSCEGFAETTIYRRVPGLSVTKESNRTTAGEIGEPIQYTIHLINNGATTIQITDINDTFPSGFVVTSNELTSITYPLTISSGTTLSFYVSGYFESTGSKLNAVSVTTSDPDDCVVGQSSNCSASTNDMVIPKGLLVTKQSIPTTGHIGDYITYIITVSNTSKYNITNVLLEDIFPPTYVGGSVHVSGGTYSNRTNIWNIGTVLANSQSGYSIIFTGYFTGEGIKTNTAFFTSGIRQTPIPTITGYCIICTASVNTSITGFCAPNITINNNYKLMSYVYPHITQASTGTVITYTARVFNIGGGIFSGNLDMSINTGNVYPLSYLTTLAPGEAIDFEVLASGNYISGNIIHLNIAGIPNLTSGYVHITNTGGQTTVNSGVKIFKTSSIGSNATHGQMMSYGITVINMGNANFSGYIVDILPSLFRLTGKNLSSLNPKIGFLTSVNLGIFQGTSFVINGYYLTGTPGIPNIAHLYDTNDNLKHSAYASGSSGGNSNCNVEVTNNGGGGSPSPDTIDLYINKSASIATFTMEQQSLFYHLDFGNSGGALYNNIQIMDYLPNGFVLTGALLDGGGFNYSYNQTSNLFSVTGLSLGQQQTARITIYGYFSGSFSSGQQFINTASIYYINGNTVGGETTYTNNTGTNSVTYIQSVQVNGWATGLSISKTVNPITGSVGEEFGYTITLTNTGMYTINNVIVSDPLSQLILNGFTGITTNPGTGLYNATNGLRSIPQIQPNQSFSLIISGHFTTSGVKVNSATLSGCQGTFGCEGNATGYVFDTGAKITKTANVNTGCIGEIITYTITLSNVGIQTIDNLHIIDSIPEGFVITASGNTGPNSVSNNGTGNRIITNFGTTNQVFTIQGFYNSTGIIINTGMISGCNNNSLCISTAAVEITNNPSLCATSGVLLDKSVSQAIASIGQAIAYLITIQNLNTYSVYDISVQEQLPEGFTGILVTPSTGIYNTATNIRYIPGMSSGSSATLLLSGYFTSTGNKVNTVSLSGCGDSGCIATVTGVITDQISSGLCGFYSGTTTSYDQKSYDTNGYCSGGSISGLIQMSGFQQRYCSGLNGGSSVGPCTMYTPSCGDGIIQTGNEACDIGIALTTGQISCNNSCKTLYTCAGTGQVYGGFHAPDLQNPSIIYNGCCEGLVGIRTNDPSMLPDANFICVDPKPDLALTKTLTNAQTGYVSGDIVNYTITIYNQGNTPTSNIQIIDYLPSGLEYATQTFSRTLPNYTSGWQISGTNLILTGRYRLNPGESLQIPLSLRVNSNASGIVSNSAELLISSGDIDSIADNNPVNDCYSGNNNISGNALSGGVCSTDTDEDDYDREDISILSGVCGNGAIDHPNCNTCTSGYIVSGGQCVINACTNGATNPPSCNSCSTGYTYNSGTNQCVINACTNGATNPPSCNSCSTGYTYNSGTNQCVPYLLSINKQGPSQVNYIINQDILYLIQITNHGPQSATGVHIQDYLPNGFALNYSVMNSLYGGNPIQPSVNGSTISWTIPSIASGQIITLFVYGKFTEVHGIGTGINTGAIVSGYCSNCTGVDIRQVDICGPEGYLLSVTKTGNKTTGLVYDMRNYTISVSSVGYATASNLLVQELFPSDFVITNYSVSNGTFATGGGSGLRTIANLSPNNSRFLQVSGYYTTSGIKVNTATITNSCATCNPNPHASRTGVVGSYPYLLDIDKSSTTGSLIAIGQPIMYALDVHNYGPETATGVVITDTLPAGFIIVPNAVIDAQNVINGASYGYTGYSYNPITHSITWNIANIISGSTPRLLIYGYPTIQGILLNTATIASGLCLGTGCFDSDIKNVDICGPEGYLLSINKSSSRGDTSSGSVRSPITYTITITNTGYKSANNISISDIVPAGFSGTATASTGSFTLAGGNRNLNLGIGQSATLTLNGYYTTSGIKTNTATITSGVCLPGNCSSTVTNTITDVPYNLIIDKSVINSNVLSTTGTALINDNLTYTISIINQGPETANNISISDSMPSGFVLNSFIPYQVSTGTFNTATMTWNIATLSSGASASLQLLGQYTTDGIKTNYAVITSGLAFNITGSASINVLACTNGMICVHTGMCNTGYHTQVYTGTPSIDTGLLCIGGTATGLTKNSTGWTRNCLGMGSGGTTNGCYLTIDSGYNSTGTCGLTGQVICNTGNTCMTGLLNQSSVCVTGCSSGYNLSGVDCVACGNSGQVLCNNGSGCTTGLVNSGGICISTGTNNTGNTSTGTNTTGTCGLTGQVICNTGNTCMTGLVNSGGICVNSCSSGYNLSGVDCVACGNSGQVLCNNGSGCTTGLVNSGGICISTGTNNTGNMNTGNTLSGLWINKTVSRLYALPGEAVTRTINFGVHGTGVYEGVTIEDILPDGGEFVSTSLSTGYSYTGGILSYTIGAITGAYTGSFTIVMRIGTGVNTGTVLTNVASGSMSGGNTVTGSAIVNVGIAPTVYIPVNLGGGSMYEPVPLPEVPIIYNETPTTIPEVITYIIRKTRILAIQAEEELPIYLAQASENLGEYIPYYTQPLEAIKRNIEVMPHTGVITLYEIIIKILKEVL